MRASMIPAHDVPIMQKPGLLGEVVRISRIRAGGGLNLVNSLNRMFLMISGSVRPPPAGCPFSGSVLQSSRSSSRAAGLAAAFREVTSWLFRRSSWKWRAQGQAHVADHVQHRLKGGHEQRGQGAATVMGWRKC